ncbi:MAG: hypothetical protein HY547_06745 [Elusimicrobia bacterium]|nr:hypothetical protein [Elusimicrobiota bacterium]
MEKLINNYGWGLPVAASTVAGGIDFGIRIIHVAMFVIFILWAIFFTYLLIRYRRMDGVKADASHGRLIWSLAPDVVVLIFEISLIVLYAIPAWSRIKIKFPTPDESHNLEIVAEQFGWIIQYPGADAKFGRRSPALVNASNPMGLDPEDPAAKDDVIGVNELHLPLGKPTLVQLTSKDVIHSFFIPEFRIKQDAVPGMKIPVWFEPTKAGQYELGCAQLCGVGHAIMRADVFVHEAADYDAWMTRQRPQFSPQE